MNANLRNLVCKMLGYLLCVECAIGPVNDTVFLKGCKYRAGVGLISYRGLEPKSDQIDWSLWNRVLHLKNRKGVHG